LDSRIIEKMTICIDCRMIDASGVGVYLRGILPWLLGGGHNFLLLGSREKLQSFAVNQNVHIIACNIKPFAIRELFFFPDRILKKINTSDFYFSPFFNIPGGIKVPVCTTIHDMIFPDMPQITSRIGLAARMWFYRRAFNKSRKIFTVSEFSKSRIENYSSKKVPVIVTHNSVQPELLKHKKDNIEKKETIVFVGNIKKHKGLAILLDAFLMARNEGLLYRLIIIGEKEKFRSSDKSIPEKIESIGQDSVVFTGFISDEKLFEYLAQASLLVQPSLYEGFGIPPLEAMTLGTRALISDIPVFREIYGDFPVTFFRAGDSGDLKEKIIDLLINKKSSSPVLSDDLLLKYTFKKTASIILEELK